MEIPRRSSASLESYFSAIPSVVSLPRATSRLLPAGRESLSPDIAVIPECSRSSIDVAAKFGFDGRWFGDKPQKGLGV
jgi:hypothetical protein